MTVFYTGSNITEIFMKAGVDMNEESTQYPKKRSRLSMIAGIILILMGISYIVNKFLPWIFAWLDSGLIIAAVAVAAGLTLLVRK